MMLSEHVTFASISEVTQRNFFYRNSDHLCRCAVVKNTVIWAVKLVQVNE